MKKAEPGRRGVARGMEGFREENWARGGAEPGVRLRAAQAEADCV